MATEQELVGMSPLERAIATLTGQSQGSGFGSSPLGRLLGMGNPPPSAPTPDIPVGGGAMIPDQAGIDALIGGGGGAPAPTPLPQDITLPPPTPSVLPGVGDPGMPTPRDMGLGGALAQIEGGASSPAPSPSIDLGGPIGPSDELPVGATEFPNGSIGYEIQPGDSLSLIGAMFGLTYDELIAANEEVFPQGKSTVIHPGTKVVIPAPEMRGEIQRKGIADKGFTPGAEAQAYSASRRG